MNDASNIRPYLRYRSRPGRILAVTGGKGGTGKTNVSVNLAIALTQRHQQVVVLDADIGLANAEVIMGLKSRETLQLVIEGERKVSDILSVGPSGVKVVPGVSGLNHLADLDAEGRHNVRLAMEELQTRFDFVIIDTMAGIGPASVAFSVAADEVLLVVTPEPSSLIDGYAMIKMIHAVHPQATISILVNMVDDQQQALRAVNNLSAAAAKFLRMPLTYAGHIVYDPHVRTAVLQSYPFTILYPGCPASRGIKELASTLLGEPSMERESHQGFFRRFAQTLGIAQ